jgi:MscS family membrane protein
MAEKAIGIRSARIRGLDRTLTTIPNAALAKIPIVNLTRRDKMLIQTVIGLRYETSRSNYATSSSSSAKCSWAIRFTAIRRARFVGFGASSLDIEVFAYVMTRDWAEFLGIREDILLRVMDIIEQGGTGVGVSVADAVSRT